MFTTEQLYNYLEEKTSKKGGRLSAREIADHFNVILPRIIAVLEFGESNCVIVRLDAGYYKARKRSKIPEDVFEAYVNTNTEDIVSNPKYKNKFWVYSKYKDKEAKRNSRRVEDNENYKDASRASYDEISRSQVGFIHETGHGRKKTAEWNDKSARDFQKQLKELAKNPPTYEKP